MGLGVHGALRTVAHQPAVARAGGRRLEWGAGIRIGQGYLAIRCIGQGLVHRLELLNFLFEPPVSLRQMRDLLSTRFTFFLPVDVQHLGDVAVDIGLQVRKAAGDLALGEVLVAVIDRLELASVDRDAVAFQSADPAAEPDELRTPLRMAAPLSRRKSAIVL